MTKEIKTVEQVPAFLQDKIQGTGRGNEEVTVDDLTLPRLEVIQALSPCLKKDNPDYIEGAEEGLLFNNVTRQLYGESVEIVFAAFEVEYLLWKERKKGGGLCGKFKTMDEAIHARKELGDTASQIDIVKTPQHYGILIDPETGSTQNIVVSMPRSKEKVSRKFNTLVSMAGGDRFARKYKVSTVRDRNASGAEYCNLKITNAGFPTEEQYLEAERIYNMQQSGKLQVSSEFESETEQETNSEF